jgi:hypothetical protein
MLMYNICTNMVHLQVEKKNSIVQLPLQTWKLIVKEKLKRLRKSLQSFIFHIEDIIIVTNGNIINIFKSLKQQSWK